MVLRDWVRFCAVDCRLLTAAVKRFWMAPNWLWNALTVERAASTEEMVLLAPATVSTFWFARVAVAPPAIVLRPVAVPLVNPSAAALPPPPTSVIVTGTESVKVILPLVVTAPCRGAGALGDQLPNHDVAAIRVAQGDRAHRGSPVCDRVDARRDAGGAGEQIDLRRNLAAG